MKSSYKIGKANLVFILLCTIPFAHLCYQIFTHNYPQLDSQILQILQAQRRVLLDFFFIGLYKIGNTYIAGSLVLATLVFLIRKRYWQEAKALAFATLGILILVDEILKPIFGRSRPPKPRLVDDLGGDSFPSGHAAGNLVFYFYLAFLLAAQYPKLTKYIYILATIIVLLIGFGSIYIKAHWATDVLGGYLFGYLWLLISLNFLKFLDRNSKVKS